MGRTFVLIHGSWHGGWAWDSVISELSEKGHWAHAPTLAGHGPGAARLGINHKACVDSVVHYIDTRALNDKGVSTLERRSTDRAGGSVAGLFRCGKTSRNQSHSSSKQL